ncbi:MAG: amidohydrolase [Candidatus Aminicenantes bacterium]|nr:amidohydrolase [Candidatus Aminicenantes bacterium]
MNKKKSPVLRLRLVLAVLLTAALCAASAPAKSNISKEKASLLHWLSKPDVVERFGRLSDAVWSYAELGMQEFKSSKLLADTLETEGFSVERGAAGMPTCFVAAYGSGRPVIGFLGEFDALPMLSQKGRVPRKDPVVEGAPGHGCGHNTMGVAAAAAAIALKNVLQRYNLPGTIKVFGSPAEETLISRPYMVRAGLFEGVDAVIDNHSSSGLSTGYGRDGNAVFSVVFTFRGRTAHSAGAPWAGRSALDAVEIMNVATNYLREHLNIAHRLHYVVLEGGEAPNVVPDKASVWYFIRNTDEEVEAMYRRVHDCAKAGALAAGAELAEVRVLSAVHQRRASKALAEVLQRNIELVGMPAWTEEEHAFARALQKELGREEKGLPDRYGELKPPGETFVGGGSSDVAEVTLVAPTATLNFPGQVPGAVGHHWSSVSSNFGSTAWKGLSSGAKVMAAAALDLLTRPKDLKAVRDEFEAARAANPYRSFLPEDARPPLDLNEELMKKWRVLMEKDYPDEGLRKEEKGK